MSPPPDRAVWRGPAGQRVAGAQTATKGSRASILALDSWRRPADELGEGEVELTGAYAIDQSQRSVGDQPNFDTGMGFAELSEQFRNVDQRR